MNPESLGTPTLYIGFSLLVLALLAVDFLVLRTQGNHKIKVTEAAAWTAFWIAIGLGFGGWFWWYLVWARDRQCAGTGVFNRLSH